MGDEGGRGWERGDEGIWRIELWWWV